MELVILSKFCFALLAWTGAYFFCFGESYLYTRFFWDTPTNYLLFAVCCVWIFGILLMALVLLGGALFASTSGTLLFTGGCVILLFFANLLPKFQEYNPLRPISSNMELLSGTLAYQDFYWSVGITAFLTTGALALALLVFNRKLL